MVRPQTYHAFIDGREDARHKAMVIGGPPRTTAYGFLILADFEWEGLCGLKFTKLQINQLPILKNFQSQFPR
jgi:hypothetical protein